MIRSISRRWWIGLLGLAWFGMTAEGQAWDNPLVKVRNVRFHFQCEVSTTPTAPPPIAPWYAYFPADPRMVPPAQASPYPPWPMQFPPPGPPADSFKDAPKRPGAANVPQGPRLTQHWSSHYAQESNLQPIGYLLPQAPSYWYQGR